MRSIDWRRPASSTSSSTSITWRRWWQRIWPAAATRDIEISEEAELLDTGGGVAQALPSLGEVFFVINGDVFWLDGKEPALLRLARAFDPERMDAVLLLQRTVTRGRL